MGAPVCNIIPADQPGAPTAKKVPTIPIATDLNSALSALNAVRAWINAQQQPPAGGAGGGSGGTIIPPPPKQPPQPKPTTGRWNELSRTTQLVKITNPADPTQFVEVLQLSSLTMQDSQTKETWVWHL